MLVGLALLVVVAVYAFLYSPVFQLEKVTIDGLEQLTRERVLEAIGLEVGDVRWQNPAAEIERRLQDLPLVQTAAVAWRVPGELHIRIAERQPLAILPYYNYFLQVDVTGRILSLQPTLLATDLPLVTGVALPMSTLGTTLEDAGLKAALHFIWYLPAPWRQQVGEVHVGDRRGLLVYGGDGELVLVGDPASDVAERAAALVAVWEQMRREGVVAAQIDVRNPAQPTVTPR